MPTEDSESDAQIRESPTRKRARFKRHASPKIKDDSDSSDVGRIHFEAQPSSPQTVPTGQSSSEAEVEPFSLSQSTKRPRILNSDSDESGNEKNASRPRVSRRLAKRDEQVDVYNSER